MERVHLVRVALEEAAVERLTLASAMRRAIRRLMVGGL